MDIATRLQQLEEMISAAKSMPLSSSILLNREEVLAVMQAIRDGLPEEIKQARWVVKDREELLSKARRDAEEIVQNAIAEQRRVASREEVVKRSQQEADRILEEAGERARRMRLEAEDWVDSKLAAFEAAMTRIREELGRTTREVEESFGGTMRRVEESLERTARQVETARQRLTGATIAQEALGGEQEGPAPEEEQEPTR